jgi:hypothetical protein
MTILYQYYGDPDKAILLLVPSYLGLRVYFSEPVYNDAQLRDPDNYSIFPYEALAVTNEVVSVTPEKEVAPSYVDLDCTDLTHNKEYRLHITEGVIQDAAQTKYFEGGMIDNFIGVSVFPTVQSIRATSQYEMQVIFSKPMAITSDLLDPSRYFFNNGLSVRSVSSLSEGVVLLSTTKQTPSELYTLTVL